MEQRRCFGCMALTEQTVCPRCGWGAGQDNEPHQLPVGTVLAGKYLVGRVLGQGGFGITYLGWDLNLDIRVCIKEFFPSSAVNRDHSRTSAVTCNTTHLEAGYASSRERFLREAKSMAKFRDVPQIVSIFDFFQANNTAYMVMQYIEGIDLAKYIRKRGGRIAMDETLRILKPVMEALSLVHEEGMIHRDIAPDNIMLHPRDGAKLMDFGAVRQVDNPDADGELTRSTEAILKNGFAPMEQYQSRGSLGPWTDVYALSATIYYCVTGRIPTEALTRMIEETPLDWSGAEGITRRQIQVLEHGMAVRIKDRIQSVKELMAALYAPGKPEPQPAPKPLPRREPEPQPAPKPLPQPKPNTGAMRKRKWIPANTIALAVVLAAVVHSIVASRSGWRVRDGDYSYYLWYGNKLSSSWLQEDGSYYYFDDDGSMVTGWQRIDGHTYYFSDGGKMRTGWQKINGSTYYFSTGGKMFTGWQKIDGKAYYFSPDGAMLTGTRTIDGRRYEFQSVRGNLLRWEKELTQQQISSEWSNIHVPYTRNNGVLDTGGTALLMDKPVVDCVSATLHLSVTDRTSGNLDQWGIYLRDLQGNWELATVFDLKMRNSAEGETDVTISFSEPYSFDAYACLCHSLEWDWGFSFNPYFTRITVLTSEPMPLN